MKTRKEKFQSKLNDVRAPELLVVQGSDREIGLAHGETYAPVLDESVSVYLSRFWKRVTENNTGIDRKILGNTVRRFETKLMGQLPQEMILRLMGFQQGWPRLSVEELLQVTVVPDVSGILQSMIAKLCPSWFVDKFQMPPFACTSLTARSSSGMLVGRNLDFPGVSYWDKKPLLQLVERAGAIPFIGFSSVGILFNGISGVNEARISVALHVNYGRGISFHGLPAIYIGEKILMEAQSLRDAERILRRLHPFTSWAFVVADGKTGESFVCDYHPNGASFRWMGKETKQAQSNFFQSQDCTPLSYWTGTRMQWDNWFRSKRLFDGEQGRMQNGSPVEKMISLIGDHYDPYWRREKITNRTVGQVFNLQSYVLDLDAMNIWLAVGPSPVQLGHYQKIDLNDVFSNKRLVMDPKERIDGFRFEDKNKESAKKLYNSSFIASMDGDDELGLEFLKDSLSYFYEAEVGNVAGIMALKLDRLDEALEFFSKSRECIRNEMVQSKREIYPPEYFENAIFLARTNLILGNASLSGKLFDEVLEHASCTDSNLKRIAKKRKYSRRDLKNIQLPYSAYVPFI